MILIDSDILIWILRNDTTHKNKFSMVVEEYHGQIFITPIQYLEITAGVKEKEKINTEIFLDSLAIINIDKDVSKLAGEFMRLYNKFHNINSADAIIAAITKMYDLKLWTNNKKYFPMLKENEFINMEDLPLLIKIFPASSGGPEHIKALKTVFPYVRFIPLGGINAKNLADYIKAGAWAIGGTWICKKELINKGEIAKISEITSKALQIIKEAKR